MSCYKHYLKKKQPTATPYQTYQTN